MLSLSGPTNTKEIVDRRLISLPKTSKSVFLESTMHQSRDTVTTIKLDWLCCREAQKKAQAAMVLSGLYKVETYLINNYCQSLFFWHMRWPAGVG